MMKPAILAIVLLLPVLASVSAAKTLNLPSDKPAVQVTVPDSYKPEESDTGYTAESNDQAVTFYFDVTSLTNLEELVTENMKYLVQQKVTIDQASKKERDYEANGFKITELSYEGKQEGFGAETIKLYLIPLDDKTMFMITYWVTKDGEKAHATEVSAVFSSIKKA